MGCDFYLKGDYCTFVMYDHETGQEIGRIVIKKPFEGKEEHPISFEVEGDVRWR